MNPPRSTWSACRCCGLLQSLPEPTRYYQRICARCETPFGNGIVMPHVALAFALTVLCLFLLAQFYPIAAIEMEGQSHAARIATDISALAVRGFPSLGWLVFGLVIAAPAMRIITLIWVFAGIQWRPIPAYLRQLFRFSELLRPWAMLDVLLLGILVSNSKLRDLAQVDTQTGFWALGLSVLAIFAMEAAFDTRAMWDVLQPPPAFDQPPDNDHYHTCHICEWLQKNDEKNCARCGAAMHQRKPASLQQTWALVIAGLILYIPANAFPVLITTSFGQSNPTTIMGGVRQLLNGQDWPLAVILFTASIIIPLFKLIGFIWLMISAHLRHRSHMIFRTRLYRFIYFIGRWSNTDIFVGATLTGLVTLDGIATNIVPGIGGVAFGAVVVLTMLAAETFDPRLMWDAVEVPHGR